MGSIMFWAQGIDIIERTYGAFPAFAFAVVGSCGSIILITAAFVLATMMRE